MVSVVSPLLAGGSTFIRGGENIYPKEIEDVLYTHPAVLEAAVVGQPDPVFGEQPVAFVTLRPGFDAVPEDLIEHCRQSLARYKVCRVRCTSRKHCPRTRSGKSPSQCCANG